jgi:hypothetical protein
MLFHCPCILANIIFRYVSDELAQIRAALPLVLVLSPRPCDVSDGRSEIFTQYVGDFSAGDGSNSEPALDGCEKLKRNV